MKGTRAPNAAGVIHNDLAKTFIQAQVTKYDDVVKAKGNESLLKSEGKIQQKGKDYVVEDGDTMYFKVSYYHETKNECEDQMLTAI